MSVESGAGPGGQIVPRFMGWAVKAIMVTELAPSDQFIKKTFGSGADAPPAFSFANGRSAESLR